MWDPYATLNRFWEKKKNNNNFFAIELEHKKGKKLLRVKEQFVRICESGVKTCPWCVRSMSLVHRQETQA